MAFDLEGGVEALRGHVVAPPMAWGVCGLGGTLCQKAGLGSAWAAGEEMSESPCSRMLLLQGDGGTHPPCR